MILDLFGYDRHGEVREIDTTLQKNALNAFDVGIAAMDVRSPSPEAGSTGVDPTNARVRRSGLSDVFGRRSPGRS
jgi:hypothetical protein